MKTKKNIYFEFNQEMVKEPLLYRLNRTFDVVINIRGASVTSEGGFVALELEGEESEIRKVFDYLGKQGIEVEEGVPGAEEA